MPLPRSLKIKGGAVTKTLEGLRKKGLLDEKPAARNSAAWREGENGQRIMLVITDAGLLARGLAYEMQVRQIGGLTPAEKKAFGAPARGRSNPSPGLLKAGTRLYRSWRGVTQEILVLDSGYSWRGMNYASLSEVARAITGTRWSGPRFFALQA